MLLPFAAAGQEMIGVVAVFGTMAAVPIVGMLTRHQQRMAEILHGRRHQEAVQAELNAVRAEVASLRSQVHVQSVALQALSDQKRPGLDSDTDSLAQRLS